MSAGIGTIEVKKKGKTLVIQGLGRTPRGQKYIKKHVPMNAKSTKDPGFKDEMSTILEKMLA